MSRLKEDDVKESKDEVEGDGEGEGDGSVVVDVDGPEDGPADMCGAIIF